MARTTLERKLTVAHSGDTHFSVANGMDDPDIRRLLRENPMPGKISISLEREPDFFADTCLPDETKQTIIARSQGQVIGVGSCTFRQRFVNGEPRRVGYLGGLRLDVSHAGRFDILRRGYEFFHTLQADAPADFYFTSIAADNEPARHFLERGLRGMPRYEFIGEFVTMFLPTIGAALLDSASGQPNLQRSELVARVNEFNRHFQFAPCWSADEMASLESLGLRAENFLVMEDGGRIEACAALWDQRSFKQTVIRDYTPALKRTRTLANFVSKLVGRPVLPAIGTTLAYATVSHLAVGPDEADVFVECIAAIQSRAAKRKIDFISLGFAANDPRLATVRLRFKSRKYRSRLYVVRWPKVGGATGQLDGRVLQPELASL